MRNIWARASVLHPLAFVGPWVALAFATATGSDDDIVVTVAIGFWTVPLAALASFITTVAMALQRPLATRERVMLVLIGVVGSGAGLVLGFAGILAAADIDCAGRYECPF